MIDDGISDLVKSILGTGLPGEPYPVILPEGVPLPAITYQIVGGSSKATFDTAGMSKLRMQFDLFDTASHTVRMLRTQLVTGLNQFQGVLSDGTFVALADYVQSLDFFENVPRQYRCAVEFNFYFNQT